MGNTSKCIVIDRKNVTYICNVCYLAPEAMHRAPTGAPRDVSHGLEVYEDDRVLSGAIRMPN